MGKDKYGAVADMSTMRQLFEETPSDVPRILSVIGATALLVYIWVTKISGKRK